MLPISVVSRALRKTITLAIYNHLIFVFSTPELLHLSYNFSSKAQSIILQPLHNLSQLTFPSACPKTFIFLLYFLTYGFVSQKGYSQMFQFPSSAEADDKKERQGQVIFKYCTVYLAALVYALGLESNGKLRQSDTDVVLTAEMPWSEI